MTFDAPTAQLLSALVGGALAITGGIGAQWALDAQRRRAERRGLAGAFAGELAALFSAMQQRRWRDRMDDLIAETERTGKVPSVVFSVRHHYFRVFDANAGRLGVLDPPLPEMLAHHYIYSKMFLEFMEDLAGKFEPHETAAALDHLHAARDLVDEGIKLSPACLEEARRQAR
jgi:hypothetical protein